MIDKNEMRIGNYFIGENKIIWLSQIRHAENVKEWSYKGWHEETKQRIEVNFFDAEPIPLTTEILQKYLLVKGLNNKKYEINDWFEIAEFEGKFYLSVNCEYLTDTEIIYVHELQNLYYILTQKELIIQL